MNGWRGRLGEVSGAFSDGAILFPLLFLLILKSGFSGPILWFSTACIYFYAGLFFKIPMPVQPLKSLVVTAVTLGATLTEVRLGALAVGFICWSLSFLGFERITRRVPQIWVHGIQLGLGVLLISQGYQQGLQYGWEVWQFTWVGGLCICAVFLSHSIPVLGLLAVVAVILGVFKSFSGTIVDLRAGPLVPIGVSFSKDLASPRISLLLALVLPQLPLTLANSVIGTTDVAQRYFKDRAYRVTPQNLLRSIGLGNCLMAVLGGIPFCHGAGGLTAHYQGGARTLYSNFIVAFFLLLFSGLTFFYRDFQFEYPPVLWVTLLCMIGLFHLKLAAPTWNTKKGKVPLILMGITALLTRNMLAVLAVGVALEGALFILRRLRTQRAVLP